MARKNCLHGKKLQMWMQEVYDTLGITCIVPAVPELTPEQRKSLEKFRFRPFFIPPGIKRMNHPATFKRLERRRDWPLSGSEPRALPGRWIAIETIAKPHWDDPAGYPSDTLGAALKLKSRFRLSQDNLRGSDVEYPLLARAAEVIGFPQTAVCLPWASEWNFIANLFNFLRERRREALPDLGATCSWEWSQNQYRLYAGTGSICTGGREHGGINAWGDMKWSFNKAHNVGFRMLIEL